MENYKILHRKHENTKRKCLYKDGLISKKISIPPNPSCGEERKEVFIVFKFDIF